MGFGIEVSLLDWEAAIAPLLDKLGISIDTLDTLTRELIRNPRELALFVELAHQQGSFNVVTSQALAQRYLDSIVRSNEALGDTAIKAIEAMAFEMLKLRSLIVPHQRFNASQNIQRELCSLNVLQETQDGKLTFGHQTLLDVLVISGAVRSGVTLNEFIQSLPPVPFIRPSIRSFVAQLALGERREFRKQLRTVLTGSVAFHIKRLIAESLAEQIPEEEDWPLMRDLREKHRDVFQVIYVSGVAIEWHRFWLKHLIPLLKATQDAEGLMGHVHRIAQWSNNDSAAVLWFWTEALSLKWVNSKEIADRLGAHLSEIRPENLALAAPLIERLLNMPQSGHSFLGRAIARCVDAGVLDDNWLWRYVTDGIGNEDLLGYRFDTKLRCQTHEFGDGNDNFVRQRMERSTVLLDLALESIERWSNVRASHYRETRIGYRHGFLSETSYNDAHSSRDIDQTDSIDVLLDAVEAAILHHAKADSIWWRKNRERLGFSHEGALLYFAILACTVSSETNIELIGRILCDPKLLEFELNYELGTLLQSAFRFLELPIQDKVMMNILNLWEEKATDKCSQLWILKSRAELICPIPCYMRSPESQSVVDAYEKKAGFFIRQPNILSSGGVVSAPFSYEIFIRASDDGVLSLLAHYNGYSSWHGVGSDFLIGGEREVGFELREASSRQSSRFLRLLKFHWAEIPDQFRFDIMDGVATYLAYRYGNLQASDTWIAFEEPDAPFLANQILDELERHLGDWHHQRSAAKALEACANVICNLQDAERLIFLAVDFYGIDEVDTIKGHTVDLLLLGINMAQGDIVEALMILVNNLSKFRGQTPELLIPTLRRFASIKHPAIRALVLRRLPYLQNRMFDLGWELFHLAMQDANGLWQTAEPCLYYAYHKNFEMVRPLLARLRVEGSSKELETWGRISALAAMTQHIDFGEFLLDLDSLNVTDAWKGAAAVWTNAENIWQHRTQCLAGIDFGLSVSGAHAQIVAQEMDKIFREKTPVICVPIDMLSKCFSVFKNDSESKHHRLFGFHEWLNATSQVDPGQALSALEIYLSYVISAKPYLFDRENCLTQLMTRLFAEAEEQEESDCGVMLRRVVAVQDTLLSLGLSGVADWLKAAERP